MTAKIHPDTLPFLQELTTNNNRPWFNDHKERWIEIRTAFEAFTQALIDEMVKYDDTLIGLTAKKNAALSRSANGSSSALNLFAYSATSFKTFASISSSRPIL